MKAVELLDQVGLRRADGVVPSSKRFPDGAEFRFEIPSVEGPEVLREVIASAERYGLVVNRVSQGSGGMLLTDAELREMAGLAADAGIEVALFVGPRAGFDIGVFSRSESGAGQYGALRSLGQVAYAVEDVMRAVEAGFRSFLVADIGLLATLSELREAGELPAECLWKVSAYMAPSNAATLRVLERMGAGTINIPPDVTVEQLAEMRAHVDLPIDLYIEAPDSMGGVVRGHEIADFVVVGAPLYVKLGLRNAGRVYPAGEHLLADAILMAREKVRRAAIAFEWLMRVRPEASQSDAHAPGCAIPRPSVVDRPASV